MKRNILFIFIFAFLAVPFFAQKYVAIDSDYRDMKYGRHGWHYVIENRVNVRDESGINGNILFQLNAGDKVQIKGYDWDEELYYAGDYYAHWIKISCSRGDGYICGRYVSCKEVEGDFDGDGVEEVFACLNLSNSEKCPIHEYRMSFDNVDKEHVLIKNGTVRHIDFESIYGGPIKKDAKYFCVCANELNPKVNFICVRIGFGDGGGLWNTDKYFYFDKNGVLKYFTSLSESHYEMDSDHIEKFIFEDNKVIKKIEHTKWENCKELPTEYSEEVFTWDGENFR